MSTRHLIALAWALAILVSSFPAALLGQTSSPPAAQAAADPAADPAASVEPQTPTFREDLVVTANPLPTPADEVGSSVTVIGAAEIESRAEPFVLDLLRTVPGLEVTQSGGPGAIASVFLRGANSSHTLVLLDGVRVTNPSGGFDLSGLGVDNVERIEVLRGPQSTLYGSEAIGGVISLTTRRGKPGFRTDLDVRAGSRGTRQETLTGDGGTSSFDWSLGLSNNEADGWSVASEDNGNHERDPYRDRNASARLGGALFGDGRVDLTLRHLDAKSDLDGFSTQPEDDLNYTQDRRLTVAALDFLKPLTSAWDLRLHASANQERNHGKDPDTFFNNYDIQSRLRQFGLESHFRTSQGGTLIAGVATERRTAKNEGSYDESLSVDSLYLQDEWAIRDRVFVTAGARHDRNSRYGDKTTYRVTANSLLPGSWRLRGSVGTGFRAPSFDELFFPFFGNPALKPETSFGADLGLERRFETAHGGMNFAVTLFENRLRDLITFDFLTSTFGNIQRAESRGAEVAFGANLSRSLELQASYTYTDSEDRATREPLARRPRNRWTLLAAFSPGTLVQGSVSLIAVDDRVDSDGSVMDNYQRVDLSLQFHPFPFRGGHGLVPYIQVQNALDQRYEEVTGYTNPRRTAFVGVRIRPFS